MPATVFDAIADDRRREILELLRAGERSAGEIASEFDVSWPAISRHLRILREADLVSERRVGRERRYALNRRVLRDVLGSWVAAFDLMWQDNLDALKLELERGPRGARPRPTPPTTPEQP